MHLKSTHTLNLQYLQSEADLECNRTSMVELFCKNSKSVKVVAYFHKRAPSCIFDRMFDKILNATLPNNLLQLEEGLRRSFLALKLHKGILESPYLLTLLIYTSDKENLSLRRQIRLTRVTNVRAVAHKSWMVRSSLYFEILTEAISTVRVLDQDCKFHAPTATEHKYDKTKIEHWPPTGIELGLSRLVTNGHNQYTIFSCY